MIKAARKEALITARNAAITFLVFVAIATVYGLTLRAFDLKLEKLWRAIALFISLGMGISFVAIPIFLISAMRAEAGLRDRLTQSKSRLLLNWFTCPQCKAMNTEEEISKRRERREQRGLADGLTRCKCGASLFGVSCWKCGALGIVVASDELPGTYRCEKCGNEQPMPATA